MTSGKNLTDMEPVTGQALVDLIPQKPPFVLISALLGVSEKKCKTSFVFSGDHVLCQGGKLSVAGLIENIAQTCAAKVGYEYSLRGKKYPLGFIGDLKDFTYSKLPMAGEEITTEISIDTKIFDVTLISGTITLDGLPIAHCRMKVYEEPEKKEDKP